MKQAQLLTILCALFFVACASRDRRPPPSEEPVPGASRRVFQVDSIAVRILETHPEQIHVEAHGQTETAGWSSPQLLQIGSGHGGMVEFEFVARPPSGPAAQVLTPITGATIVVMPDRFEGVRVLAKENSKTSG